MALYPTIKGQTDDDINTNGIQAITGEVHNAYLHDLIDAVGDGHEIFGPVATTYNPGSPEAPTAYFLWPGTYTNFSGITITSPLGIAKWNGTAWSAVQLPMPSGHNYFLAVTTQARVGGTPYTSVNISQASGGYTAFAGQWVKLIDRTTGRYDYVQLTADVIPADTSITFESRTFTFSMSVGSIVEVYPMIGMRWWATIPVVGVGLNYVDMTTGWRPPPVEAVQYTVYMERLIITRNGFECQYNSSPTEEWHYKLNASNRLRVEFGTTIESGEIIRIKLWQPAVLETYTPPS